MATIGFSSGRGVLGKFRSHIFARALRNVAEKWADAVRKAAPYDRHKHPGPDTRETGEHLKQSIYVRTRGTSIEVVSDRKYLAYVLKGTKKHRIPAGEGVVSFYWPNGIVIGTSGRVPGTIWRYSKKQGRKLLRFPEGVFTLDHVKHPGAKANNFVKRELPLLRKLLKAELRKQK